MLLITIRDKIKHLLDKRNHVTGIFINSKRAFDTVDQEIMLRKSDGYGIWGHANMFFTSYLINKRQFTLANDVR